MYTIKPMPLKTGAFRLSRLRGSINTLGATELERQRENESRLDFASYDIPFLPAEPVRRTQMKPAPIDLRLRMDLRDVKLYVDVIVDMLLQSLDGREYPGSMSQNGGLARLLSSNPEARRTLKNLLDRAQTLKADKTLSTEEIIHMLASNSPSAGVAVLNLPLSLKNISITREKSSGHSRLGRRERLIREARKLVLERFPMFGQSAQIITKQKDDGSALHVVVPRAEPESGAKQADAQMSAERREPPREQPAEIRPESPPAEEKGFVPARVEYLRDYRRADEKASMELLRKLVDPSAVAQLSSEAAASLNRMIEQGKLVPTSGQKAVAEKPRVTADATMTYASLYANRDKPEKSEQEYNIIIKNLYYNEKMSGVGNIRSRISFPERMRHIKFGRGFDDVSISRAVSERRPANGQAVVQTQAAVTERAGSDRQPLFFAQAPAAAAAAEIKARHEAMPPPQPAYAAPDMSKLKNELAKQAGKELDDIIKRKLNVDKLTDKIYRNLENRMRSERIRRGII